MSKNLFVSLIFRLSQIYFSNYSNKEALYKKEIFYTLKDKGGVYNKFLQVLCVTKKFMAGWATPKEFEVYNKASEEVIDVYSLIPHQELYDKIEAKPVAIGSFAQVYRGYLKTGEVVALKVLKPSVYHNLKKDLKVLKRLVKIFSYFITVDILDINAAFKEFSEVCLLETDYEREISNMTYFYNMFLNHNYIVIPKVYKDLSNKYLIVQEYIEGCSLADVITSLKDGEDIAKKCFKLLGSNLWKQLIVVGGELIREAMVEDFIYGDAHAGNIILLPRDKVAFIDFGIVARAPISHQAFYDWVKDYNEILNGRLTIKNFIKSTCNCYCPDYINALNKCRNYPFFEVLTEGLENKFNKLRKSNHYIDELIKNGHAYILITEFINQKNFLGISLDMRNFQLLKAIQAYICTIYTIDKRFASNNFSFLMMGCIEYALGLVKKVENDYVIKSKYDVSQAYELLDTILSKIADNDGFLFNNILKELNL